MQPREKVALWTQQMRAPEEIYKACKTIDADPGPGTYDLAALRVLNYKWVHDRQVFYEFLGSFDDIFAAIGPNLRLLGHCPVWAFNGVVASVRIFESAHRAFKGRLTLPKPGEAGRGIHSVALCGFDNRHGEAFVFKNSWGVRWGHNGYGLLSREYVNRYLIGAWLRRRTRWGTSPFNFAALAGARSDEEFARTWMRENPRWRIDLVHRRERIRLLLHETVSVDSSLVEVIEARDAMGFRIGWAHLFHPPATPRRSVLKELYVWPSHRRRGIGTLLEDVACCRSHIHSSESIAAEVHELDARDWCSSSARHFGKALGYAWTVSSTLRPNLVATGNKVL